MGKVHGSLARAGKVKSQTPKVEPQEKKKTPKGRAKKRITYTRRFVNVTMTGGKRKALTRRLATPSIHYWAARPFPSPGIHDDDSKFWRTCMADQLLIRPDRLE
ncbi:hypothetical protein KCU83_g336, partial [Aureobasidium melanogenum]